MNNKGQFLLYDMLLAVIIILLVLVSTTYLLETNSIAKTDTNRHKDSRYLLNLIEDEGLLTKLSLALDRNDSIQINKTIEKIDYILSSSCKGECALSDENTNQILINHAPKNYKDITSSKKHVNNHTYVIKEYN